MSLLQYILYLDYSREIMTHRSPSINFIYPIWIPLLVNKGRALMLSPVSKDYSESTVVRK